MEEMWGQFQWLVKLLAQNNQKWSSAYRDFANVLLLLYAVEGLEIVQKGNGKTTNGVFHASTGNHAFNISTFIDIMGLKHSSATWGNKLKMHFQLVSLHSYIVPTGGVNFQDPVHQAAWGIVNHWVENQDKLLPESWIMN